MQWPTPQHCMILFLPADELPEIAEAVLIDCSTCSLVVRVSYSLCH